MGVGVVWETRLACDGPVFSPGDLDTLHDIHTGARQQLEYEPGGSLSLPELSKEVPRRNSDGNEGQYRGLPPGLGGMDGPTHSPLRRPFLSCWRVVAIQDRKRVARRRSNCEARFAPRGGFDLDTRRKPQAYLAGAVSDAGIMDIECHFLV